MGDGRGQQSAPAWLMDFTSNAAETFVTAYYAAADSPQRSQLLPSLYLPTSSIAWNGNPISGAAQFAQLLDAQPGSQHEIQSFDCHPLGTMGASGAYERGVWPTGQGHDEAAHLSRACLGNRTALLADMRHPCTLNKLTSDRRDAPSLLLVVSGTVAHYTPESLATNASSAPKSATTPASAAASKRKFDADAPLSTHPRVFSQSFVLVNGNGSNAEGGVPFVWTQSRSASKGKSSSADTDGQKTVARYFIQADALRFVG